MMPGLFDLFFRFNGRIARKSWWLGTLILVAASLAGTLILDPSVFDLDRAPPRTPNLTATIWQLALVIPGTAVMVKRLNDRNWPYWLGFAYGALGAMITAGHHFNMFLPGFSSVPENIVIVLAGLASVYAFVETGLLRGNMGPNRYGPDPLATRELIR